MTDGGTGINIPDEKSDEKSPFLLTQDFRFLFGCYRIERPVFAAGLTLLCNLNWVTYSFLKRNSNSKMGENNMSDETQTENEMNDQTIVPDIDPSDVPDIDPSDVPDIDPSDSTSVGSVGILLTAVYLILFSIILLVAIVQCWPSSVTPRGPVNSISQTKFLLWTFSISNEACLILIVVLAGALGGQVRSLRSLAWYTGNKELKKSWLLQYILSPFVGATLAIVTYFVIRGGFVSAGSTIQQSSVYVYAGIASVVGIASEPVALKLKQVAESLFTKPGEGKDSNPQK